jgi:hypothetical protein
MNRGSNNEIELGDSSAGLADAFRRARGGTGFFGVRPGLWWDKAALALLFCTALVVLAVPVFPSQDGPVHLYYVDVLRSLLTHSGPYVNYFEIKSLLTPYSLEYYSLLGLEFIFSPLLSERILVCCYILAFGFGYRYLVHSVAIRGSAWTLAGIPFCMNSPVYLGFLNYSFGVALALFLCGFWIRYQGSLRRAQVLSALACFLLMLLTHPLPVVFFLLFAGIHTLALFAREAAASPGRWTSALRARARPVALLALMAVSLAGWVRLFVNPSQHYPPSHHGSWLVAWSRATVDTLLLWPVAPFISRAYRAGLLLLLATVVLAACAGIWRRRRRASSAAIALGASSVVCFLAVVAGPENGGVSGAAYIPERLAIFWVMFLIAAAASFRPARQWSLAVGAVALCVGCFVVPYQWSRTTQLAREMQPVLQTPAVKAGSIGVSTREENLKGPADLGFDPFISAGVHYYRRSGALMANALFLDMPHIMLRRAHPDRWSGMPYPQTGRVISRGLAAGDAFPDLGFVLNVGAPGRVATALDGAPGWRPLTSARSYFGIYTHSQPAPLPQSR